jgi:ATP-dependent helicase/nuclease subunit A
LQILRDYAIDAKLQPNFKTLSQVESHLIKREAIYNAFDQYLNQSPENNESENNETTKQILFTQYKPKEIKNFVEKLLAKPDIFNNIAEIYNQNENKYLEIVEQNFMNLTKNVLADFVNILKFSLDSIDEKTKNKIWTDKTNKEFAENLQNQILEDFKQFENDFSKFKTLVKNLFDLCSIKTKTRYYIPKLLKAASSENSYEFNFAEKKENLNASKYRNAIAELFSANENSSQNILLQFNLAKQVIEITKLAKNEIVLQKQKLNGIDFEDMLLITRNLLLEHPEIAQTISSEYSNIMVDEFQDTNNIQYDIIKTLVPSLDLQKNNPNISPKLFIVGDEKQSIYRFRNADVGVFYQAKQEIKISNEHFLKNELQNTKIPNSGIIKLTATFRMQPAITAFVNKVCGNIFSEYYNKNNDANNNNDTDNDNTNKNHNKNEIAGIEYSN